MSDANRIDQALKPPLTASETDLIWYAPAGGLSGALLMVLFLDLGIVLVLVGSRLFMLAAALLVTLALLVVFSLINAAHLLGPGGITVQRPFGTESHSWADFGHFQRSGQLITIHYADPNRAQPLRVHTRDQIEEVAKALSKYLPETPAEDG